MQTSVGSSVTDIVTSFQKSAGAAALLGGEKQEDQMEIAAAARNFLAGAPAGGGGIPKTALKNFSYPEQQALINEGSNGASARNLGDLKISGTHYEPLEASLAAQEADLDATDLLI
jgi:hypothetical protein